METFYCPILHTKFTTRLCLQENLEMFHYTYEGENLLLWITLIHTHMRILNAKRCNNFQLWSQPKHFSYLACSFKTEMRLSQTRSRTRGKRQVLLGSTSVHVLSYSVIHEPKKRWLQVRLHLTSIRWDEGKVSLCQT